MCLVVWAMETEEVVSEIKKGDICNTIKEVTK